MNWVRLGFNIRCIKKRVKIAERGGGNLTQNVTMGVGGGVTV